MTKPSALTFSTFRPCTSVVIITHTTIHHPAPPTGAQSLVLPAVATSQYLPTIGQG